LPPSSSLTGDRSPTRPNTGTGLTRNVILLGLVSLLTDISSEMTLTFLPFFLANVLAAKTAVIGLIEGIADSTGSLSRLFSGWLSDLMGRRKGLALLGYGLSALSKPLLYFAGSWGTVLAVRFADRLGKGVRTPPRDALLAASNPKQARGLAFGFHRGADSAGAFIGLAVVALVIYLTQGGAPLLQRLAFQRLVLIALVPGFVALGVLALVQEISPQPRSLAPPRLSLSGMDARFRWFLVAVTLFTLGNSSDAFLLLRAQNLGLTVFQVALLLAGFNLFYAVLSPIMGRWSDRVRRRRVIVLGWAVYAATYLGFALARAPQQVIPLFFLYAVYYGLSEGAARALVADLVPQERRGTAYGLYSTAVGITALPASLIAGLLWQGLAAWKGFGPPAPFLFGAALAALAMLVFLTQVPSQPAED